VFERKRETEKKANGKKRTYYYCYNVRFIYNTAVSCSLMITTDETGVRTNGKIRRPPSRITTGLQAHNKYSYDDDAAAAVSRDNLGLPQIAPIRK